MYINDDSLSAILSRQNGNDTLSWIERFGLQLLEKGDTPDNFFVPGHDNHILVLRLGENMISAHYCYFRTGQEGNTRFCVNTAVDVEYDKLKKMMEDANWNSPATKGWWNEVFRGGDAPVDEDILRRQEVMVSNSLNENMFQFVENIGTELENVIDKTIKEKKAYTKICLVDGFAEALPLRYALSKMFPNVCITSHAFTETNPLKDYTFQQGQQHFIVPKELFNIALCTTPQMTIADIVRLETNSIVFTIPLTKQDGENEWSLPDSSIFNDIEIKWCDLFSSIGEYDYLVGNLAFKQLRITVLVDGIQNIYLKSSENITIRLSCDNKHISVVHPQKDTTTPADLRKDIGIPSSTQSEDDTPVDQNSTVQTDGGDTTTPIQYEPTNTSNNSNSSIDYYKKKTEIIADNVSHGIVYTTDCLKKFARSFLLNHFKDQIPQVANENDKEQFWKDKYGDCLKKFDWQKHMLKTWNKYHSIEYSNFHCFIKTYKRQLSNHIKSTTKITLIEAAVLELKKTRNLKSHLNYHELLAIGRTDILFSFERMKSIAEQLNDDNLMNDLKRFRETIEQEWDNDFDNYWRKNF